jgi:cardiolipin synthase
MSESGFLGGNQLQLLESGLQYFPALLQEIAAARYEIHLETYIFADDVTGRTVVEALRQAALRGVRVHVLVDGFGARDFVPGLACLLTDTGVDLLVYRPEIAVFRLRRHRLRRLHRKLVVVDGRVAFVGGINVIDDMDTPGTLPPRFDYAVRIEGPLVGRVHGAMRHVWRLVRWAHLGKRPPVPNEYLGAVSNAAPVGHVSAQFLVRDNLRHRRDIEAAYLAAIQGAQQQVLIANAYFLPGRHFRRAMLAAAARGVRVTLLLQGQVEYALLHYATQSLYAELLAGGIEVAEYHKSFLHAKVAVVDEDWATVGSSNIDPFSLLLAREANVVVKDRAFASQLRTSLERAINAGAIAIRQEDLQRRPWPERMLSRVAFATVRLLIGVSGYLGRMH